MFQNDDTDLVALSVDPQNPNRIWHQGAWVDLSLREETIAVKGADSVVLQVRSSPHGPVINDAAAERIERWASSAGRENIIAGNDCGFASNAGNSEIPTSVAWAKLQALGEGARIASRRLWPR